MFINFWYVAAQGKDLKDEPKLVRMLGQDFVLFRDSSGAAHCLSNVCCHRGASLAHGKVIGNCIQCSYHGWQYDENGICRFIPSMGKDAKIPSRAKVDAYPTIERFGLVFAFLGDLPAEERPPIMEVAEWGKEGWHATCVEMEWDLYYQRSIENSIDPAHNQFTHTTHIETPDGEAYKVRDIQVDETEWTGFSGATVPGKPLQTKKMRDASNMPKPAPVKGSSGYHGISCIRTYIDFSPDAGLHQYLFETPVDETRTRVTLLMTRNFLLDPAEDAIFNERNAFVAGQDQRVMEQIRPQLPPTSPVKEVLVPADAGVMSYRKRVAEWQARGWRIDIDAVNRDGRRTAYAIPSPARRTQKGWAIEPVPLLPADKVAVQIRSA